MGLTLREMFVKLSLDVNGQQFAKAQLAVEGIKLGLHTVVAAAEKMGHAIIDAIAETAKAGEEIEDAAQATGLTTQALQELRKAASATGLEAGELDVALYRLSRGMVSAKQGGEEQAKAFHRLGVSVTDSQGRMKTADAVVMDLAAGFEKMPDGAEKSALAMDIFGRTGARLIPMLNEGKEGLAKFRAEAFVMTKEQIKAGEELVRSWKKLSSTWERTIRSAIAPILPEVNRIVQRLTAWVKEAEPKIRVFITKTFGALVRNVTQFVEWLKKAEPKIRWFASAALGALVSTVKLLGTVVEQAQKHWVIFGGILVAIAGKAAAAWLLASLPIAAVVGSISMLAMFLDDLEKYKEDPEGKKWNTLTGKFKKATDEWLKPNANDPWWLRAIKELVIYMERALGIARNLGLAEEDAKTIADAEEPGQPLGPKTEAEQKYYDEAKGREAKRSKEDQPRRVSIRDMWMESLGYAYDKFDKFTDRLAGVKSSSPLKAQRWLAGEDQAAAPGVWTHDGLSIPIPSLPSSSTKGPTVAPVSMKADINLHFAPGASVENNRQMVREELKSWWETTCEEAAASCGGDR